MDKKNIKFLVITANVGSLFEEYGEELAGNWVKAFHKLLEEQKPSLLALHLQEVGGKTHQVSKKQVNKFFENLYRPESFRDYTCIQSYVDEEYEEYLKYTAMGCSYFVHKSLKEHLQQWNFTDQCYVGITEGRVIRQMSNESTFLRKFKFPLSCYSKHATRLPRKGFTWSKWRIHNKVFVLLNVHLTHDACNVNITLKNKTKYSNYRKRSLEYTLEQLKDIEFDHHIMFGDFNVRPDTKALVEHLMGDQADKQQIEDSKTGKPHTVIYKSLNGSTQELLKVQERLFEFADYDAFDTHQEHELLQFDKELDWLFKDRYSEAPIQFRPTYPHKEDPEDRGTYSFANVRCPSWCDRIIMDKDLYSSIESSDCIYDTFGEDVALGDHKPVYMSFIYPYGLPADQ